MTDGNSLASLFSNESRMLQLADAIESMERSVSRMADRLDGASSGVKAVVEASEKVPKNLKEGEKALKDTLATAGDLAVKLDAAGMSFSGYMNKAKEGLEGAGKSLADFANGSTSVLQQFRSTLDAIPTIGPMIRLMFESAYKGQELLAAGRAAVMSSAGQEDFSVERIRSFGKEIYDTVGLINARTGVDENALTNIIKTLADGGMSASSATRSLGDSVEGFGSQLFAVSAALDTRFNLSLGTTAKNMLELTKGGAGSFRTMADDLQYMGQVAKESGSSFQSVLSTVMSVTSALKFQGVSVRDLTGAYSSLSKAMAAQLGVKTDTAGMTDAERQLNAEKQLVAGEYVSQALREVGKLNAGGMGFADESAVASLARHLGVAAPSLTQTQRVNLQDPNDMFGQLMSLFPAQAQNDPQFAGKFALLRSEAFLKKLSADGENAPVDDLVRKATAGGMHAGLARELLREGQYTGTGTYGGIRDFGKFMGDDKTAQEKLLNEAGKKANLDKGSFDKGVEALQKAVFALGETLMRGFAGVISGVFELGHIMAHPGEIVTGEASARMARLSNRVMPGIRNSMSKMSANFGRAFEGGTQFLGDNMELHSGEIEPSASLLPSMGNVAKSALMVGGGGALALAGEVATKTAYAVAKKLLDDGLIMSGGGGPRGKLVASGGGESWVETQTVQAPGTNKVFDVRITERSTNIGQQTPNNGY